MLPMLEHQPVINWLDFVKVRRQQQASLHLHRQFHIVCLDAFITCTANNKS